MLTELIEDIQEFPIIQSTLVCTYKHLTLFGVVKMVALDFYQDKILKISKKSEKWL